jgi:spore coat polysaccharide biosynthesis protein SpsF
MKKKPSYLITIEARMNSKRLPGKVLKNLGFGFSPLKLILCRLKNSSLCNNIIVATSTNKKDNKIVELAKKMGVHYYRGSENDVLSRLCNAVYKFEEDTIIQLTADNPLIDIEIIKFLVKYYNKQFFKVDFLTNNNFFDIKSSSPLGTKVSIIKKKKLLQLNRLTLNKKFREYPSLFFYTDKKRRFRSKNIKMPKKWTFTSNVRLTLDTKEDLKIIKFIYKKLKSKINFSLIDIKKIINKYPEITLINNNIEQKKPFLN